MAIQISPTSISLAQTAIAPPTPAPARPAPVHSETAPASRPGDSELAVAQVNQHLQQAQTELKVQMDAGSGRTVIQVVQQGTGQVVLQMPSDEVLGMSRRIRDMEGQTGSSGVLVDKEG
jgi:flagellar protein FlaG